MKRIKQLLEEVKKHRKSQEAKFVEIMDNLEDAVYAALSERKERLYVFFGFLIAAMLFVVLGLVFDIEPQSIIGAVSGKEQSGTFNFVPNVYSFAVFCFVAPFIYMMMKKIKNK